VKETLQQEFLIFYKHLNSIYFFANSHTFNGVFILQGDTPLIFKPDTHLKKEDIN
jgi:hypothetical protein